MHIFGSIDCHLIWLVFIYANLLYVACRCFALIFQYFKINFQEKKSSKTSNSAEIDPTSSQSDRLNETAHENVFLDLSFESNASNDDSNDDTNHINQEINPSIDNSENNEHNKEKIRNKFEWSNFKEFGQLDDAFDFLEDEGFVCYDDKNLNMGQKFYYRCKKTPKAISPYCACRYIIFLPSNSDKIIIHHK